MSRFLHPSLSLCLIALTEAGIRRLPAVVP